MPRAMQTTYDPLTVLAFVAPQTRKVRLGTSILVASYRSPLVVAKMGATLDVISWGRLILGIGAGWNSDEFTASGQSLTDRHEQADEFLLVLKELWTADQPEFTGKYYRVPRSIFLPKPLQKPHPPIWIGGNSRRAIRGCGVRRRLAPDESPRCLGLGKRNEVYSRVSRQSRP